MNALAMLTGVTSVVDAARSLGDALKKSHEKAAQKATTTTFASELDSAIGKFVKSHDKDGNGSLSLKEFGGDSKTFAALDVNHDGTLSTQELKALFTSSNGS